MTNATIRKIAHCAELAMAKALYYFRALAMSCREWEVILLFAEAQKAAIVIQCKIQLEINIFLF